MTEISLRQYLGKIDALLEEELYDQAAFHCQHILQQLPKNVAVYRRLGQAFLFNRRWEDAAEVLRRVLSVAPDDRGAHIGLSRCYYHLRQQVEAIWHLERAYEQDTSNQDVINDLRRLYREYRDIDHPRLQLTSGAIARQYARNGLYDQAVDVLNRVLKEKADRFDLRLLRARILHEAGRQVDAAEGALELLNMLPDSLEANYILAELWLKEDRPSDAQRYLSRIEPVDPYLALKLALATEADDDAVIVIEGDYQRAASRYASQSSLDWLSVIDADTVEETEDTSPPSPAALDFLDDDSDVLETASGATISADLASDWNFDTSQEEETPSEDSDWLDQVARVGANGDTLSDSTDKPRPARKTGLTGLLASLRDDDLEDSVVQKEEQPEAEDIPEGESTPEQISAVVEEQPDIDLEPPTVPSEFNEEEDPFAWMHTSGIEMVDTPVERYRPSLEDDLTEGELSDPDEADPLAWMRDSGIEMMDDEDEPEALATEADDKDDPLAWMRDSGIEMMDDEDEQTAGEIQSATQDAISDEDAPDWLADESLLDELLDIEAMVSDEDQPAPPATEAHEESDEISPQAVDAADAAVMFADSEQVDGQDAMPDKTNPENHDWMDSGNDEEDWLNQNSEPDSESTPEEGADIHPEDDLFVLDWLEDEETESEEETRQTSEPLPDPEALFDWATDENDEAITPSPADASTEQGLPGSESEEDEPEEDFIEPALFGDTDSAMQWSTPDESASASDITEEGAFGAFEEETPDWLAASAPQGELGFDEINETPDEESSAEEAFGAFEEETPDWLAASAPQGELGFDEINETPDEESSAEEAFTTFEEETPDWLAASAPQSDVSFDEDDETPDEESSAEEAFATFEEETPDWLAASAPQSDVSFDEDDETPDEESSAEEAFATFEEETPDWLAASAPQGELGFDEDDETPDEESSAEEAFATFEEETPDWLAAIAPQGDVSFDEDDETPDEESSAEEAFATFEEETPDWLAAIAPQGDVSFDEDDETPDEESSVEEAFATFEEETPDWLAASAPQSDVSFDEDDETPDEESSAEEAFATFEEETPDWLAEAASLEERPTEDDAADIEETFAASHDEGNGWDDHEMRAFEAIDDGVEDSAGDSLIDDGPEWLREAFPQGEQVVDDADEDADFEMDAGFATDDEAEWSAEERPAAVEDEYEFPFEQGPVIETDAYDMMAGQAASADDTDDESAALPLELFDEVDTEEEATFEQLSGVEAQSFDFEGEAEFGDSAAEDEEVAAIPADNAPDWLNAMVPGLDIDYEAEEDQQTEQTFIEPQYQDPTARPGASGQDVDWLTELVEEESNKPPTTLPSFQPAAETAEAAESPAEAPARKSRFSFSRKPAWMRGQESLTTEADELEQLEQLHDLHDMENLDELDDLDDEAFGEDLPDWLNLDDDEDYK